MLLLSLWGDTMRGRVGRRVVTASGRRLHPQAGEGGLKDTGVQKHALLVGDLGFDLSSSGFAGHETPKAGGGELGPRVRFSFQGSGHLGVSVTLGTGHGGSLLLHGRGCILVRTELLLRCVHIAKRLHRSRLMLRGTGNLA